MCGVAGGIARQPHPELGALVARMTTALSHRGPDGAGIWCSGPSGQALDSVEATHAPTSIVLGHRRLSIIDLAAGAQPMPNETESVWVSYNGEIYNFEEIRQQLEVLGHVFRTHCDTEVLVHGWEQWGTALFGRLNGIYALAIADVRAGGEVVLARDPLGVKPMYVGVRGGITWWSSELNAAREVGLAAEDISADALKLYFTFRFIPSPFSIFNGSWKLPPGHYARIPISAAGSEPVMCAFATEVRSSAAPATRDEWRDALIAELEAGVRRQVMSDVPVGSLLSGGIDSSLVTAMMRDDLSYLPMSFGIGFTSDGTASEAVAAASAAKDLGVPHTTTIVEDADYIAGWASAVRAIGEPVANSGGLLLHLLCKKAGETHKVVLTGQGADEPLGGYPRHMVERLHAIGSRVPALARLVARAAGGGDNGARLRRALEASTRLDRFIAIFSVMPPEVVDRLVSGGETSSLELARAAVSRWLPEASGDPVNDLLYVDARMSLADDLLLIADHFSMLASVELRVPFLDLRFLELAERMPSRYKISRTGSRKWLYREGAARRLPPALARRLFAGSSMFQRKRGFSTPLARWFSSADGPLNSPKRWTEALERVPGLSATALASLNGAGAHVDSARQRAALSALAMWSGARSAS